MVHIGRENLDPVFTEFMTFIPRQVILAALVRRPMFPLEEIKLVIAGPPQGGVDVVRFLLPLLRP